jgi:hypothetical protein
VLMKVEIVSFWGNEASASASAQRLAEVIQAGSGLGASMQTPCRLEHLYCYCDGVGSTEWLCSIRPFRLHQA